MPTVPYSPVPAVQQTPASGLSYQNAGAATPDAFGAQVGSAEQALGMQMERVGDMVAKHANVLQDRLNEADGNDLFVKWDIDKVKAMTEFQQLEGKHAKDALPKFLEDQEALRQKYLSQAPNIEVKRIFDNNSKRQFGYAVGEAGRYAANQLRSYENKTAEAVVANEVDNAKTISSPEQLEDSLKRVRSVVRSNTADTHGLSEESVLEKQMAATSQIIASKVDALAMSDPVEARRIYEQHKDSVNGKTQLLIEKHLQQADTNVGTRIVAHDIVAGKVAGVEPLTQDSDSKWLSTAQDAARKLAQDPKYANNPGFEDQLQTRISTEYNLMKKGKSELERGNVNTLREAINGSSGNPRIVSEDTIHTNPVLESIWNQMDEGRKDQMRALIKKNTKEDVPTTQARVDKFQTIMGERLTDPNKFLMHVPGEEDLTFAQQNQLFKAQSDMRGQIQSDARMHQAISTVTPMLAEAGIVQKRSDKAAMETYNQFVGAFEVKLKEEAERNGGKFPDRETQEKIAAQLLRTEPRPGMFGQYGFVFGSDEPAFTVPKQTIGDVHGSDEIRKNFIARYGQTPTPQQIYVIYSRMKKAQ